MEGEKNMAIIAFIAFLMFLIEGVFIASGKAVVSRFQAAINAILLALIAFTFFVGYL